MAGCAAGGVTCGVAGRVRGARARTVAYVISGAQVSHTSARVHTWPTLGSWRKTSTTAPVHSATLAAGCGEHCWARQWQAALGRTVAVLACAVACCAAKTRSAARSLERGGILHPTVVQVTVAVRSAWPVSLIVQDRPGMRAAVDASLYAVVVTGLRSSGVR